MRFAKTLRTNSLRWKILLAFVAGVVLSIVLFVVAATVALQTNTVARVDLADLAEKLAGKLRYDDQGRPAGFNAAQPSNLVWVFESLRSEAAYRVLDERGEVALLSGAGAAFWPRDAVLADDHFDFEHDGVTMHGAGHRFERGGRTWHMQVAASTRFVQLVHRVAAPIAGMGITVFSAVLMLTFGLCAFVTLRYTLKPLQEVSDQAAAISPRSLHARLKTDSVPCEIAPLVDSFNRALDRLEQGYRVQQEFLSHAAHELKTPLGLIRAQIELKGDGDALLGDVEYMTRQVQQLLLLAEASELQSYDFGTVRVRDIADEAAAYLQRLAETAGVNLTVSATDDAVAWRADRGALFTLLKNLLENAIQHAPPRTTVGVEIHAGELTVRDFGPGVHDAQVPLLFERFWRAEHRRDLGAGLGLAICREIALAHGWRLTAERAEPGLRLRLATG